MKRHKHKGVNGFTLINSVELVRHRLGNGNIRGFGNGFLKRFPHSALLGAQIMERLTQVIEDLDEIVQLTQSKKPEGLRLNSPRFFFEAEKKGPFALLDAYRSIALMGIAQGRYAIAAYAIGKRLGEEFGPISEKEFAKILNHLGLRSS